MGRYPRFYKYIRFIISEFFRSVKGAAERKRAAQDTLHAFYVGSDPLEQSRYTDAATAAGGDQAKLTVGVLQMTDG